MRTLKVCSDVGTIFFFDPPEGFKMIVSSFADGELRIEEVEKSNGLGTEVARFNEGHWAWYRWEEATEPADE
ncbi:hypothetical protein LCGC14_1339500 [marine sediment metagenome]|uniref:Uncharacterized protein n=1 Tax=marine sediment metagenome TaxID=412755 RepID=A0A0F9L0F9_9ZZZZ